MKFDPRRLVPLVVVIGLVVGGVVLDRQRETRRSSLSGVFETQPTKVSSRQGGRVFKILVKEGDAVKKGQVLIEFEAKAATQDVEASKSIAKEAESRQALTVKGPRVEEITRQAAVVSELTANLRRLRNGSRPEEIAIARQQVNESQARYDAALKGPRDEDLRAAQEADQEAYYAYEQAKRGPTDEERAQIQARFNSAKADADNATTDAERELRLLEQGASSRRTWEAAQARALQSKARANEAAEALRRAKLGTPTEELAQARHAYERSHAQYLAVKNGTRPEDLRVAKAALESAKESFTLIKKGPRSEDVQAATSRLAQAQATLDELRNGSRPEEVEGSRASADAARLQAESANTKLEEKTLTAPTDGVVERILVADGDLVASGQQVIQMNDPTNIWLRAYVPESALAKVEVGSQAVLLVDGIDAIVNGVVESIASQGEFTPANLQTPEERGKQVFAVRVRLTERDTRIKAGMAVTVKRLGQWP